MQTLLHYYGQACTVCFLLGFFAGSVTPPYRNTSRAVAKGLAASMIPTGAILILGAFDLTILPNLGEAGLYVALAGAVVLLEAIKELFF
jgi:hypothetical protein